MQQVIPENKALRERSPSKLLVNEIFYSIQGEGCLAGTPMVFYKILRL